MAGLHRPGGGGHRGFRQGLRDRCGGGRRGDEAALARLAAVEWDFASARTGYLTHNLHPYPAKFIPQIPNALIQELSSIGETVADVFCGSGTTLLEALLLKRSAIGIDANPLAARIGRTIAPTRKAFNPRMGGIRTENVLILRKA